MGAGTGQNSLLRSAFRLTVRTLVTAWVVLTLTFFVVHALPGTPFDEQIPEHLKTNLMARYALDQPLTVQYVQYLKNILKLDFGESVLYPGQSFSTLISSAGVRSLQIGGWAFGLALLGGVGVCLWLKSRSEKSLATWLRLSELVLVIPSFVVVSVLVWFFGYYLNVASVAMIRTPGDLLLPIAALAVRPLCLVSKIFGRHLRDLSAQPFVIALQAKGISNYRLLFVHLLPLALQPLLPLLGTILTDLLTGAIVVELLFGIQGLGLVFLNVVEQRDYNVVCSLTMVFAVVLVFFNYIFDLIRLWLDPRLESQ
jgi:ABC-type dipeptide/oligopeptide/nickel transport system permease component